MMSDTLHFSMTDRIVAVVGNGAAWLFAAEAGQTFAWVAAGIASLATALYMGTKWVFMIQEKTARKVIAAAEGAAEEAVTEVIKQEEKD